jgi:hypothetical protein
VRHQKQVHTSSDVLVEFTPSYPHMQVYLYRDEDYAMAALERMRFENPRLNQQPRKSNSVWHTHQCDDFTVILDATGGVMMMTVMTREYAKLEELISCLAENKLSGERLENWYSPTKQMELPLDAKPIKGSPPMQPVQYEMPNSEAAT